MRLRRAGEFGAIERIKRLCKAPGREVVCGMGDDAAAYKSPAGMRLAATDMMVEGVHFDLSYTGFGDLGRKALAVNLSDIAAMGGRPRYYLVSLALPADMDTADLEALYGGMEEEAGAFGVRAIGGDTCGTPGPLVISITVLGEARPGRLVRRSGARPGDDIYVTGTLGDSAGGLELLKAGKGVIAGRRRGNLGFKDADGAAAGRLVARHLRPTPRVKAGRLLAGLASAMIDISDGLSSDLGHILDESGAGALVYKDRLPVSDGLKSAVGGGRALGLALHGGEDYELLFTAGVGKRDIIMSNVRRFGTAVTPIGTVTGGKGAFLVSGDGKRTVLRAKGYEHFHG